MPMFPFAETETVVPPGTVESSFVQVCPEGVAFCVAPASSVYWMPVSVPLPVIDTSYVTIHDPVEGSVSVAELLLHSPLHPQRSVTAAMTASALIAVRMLPPVT